MIPPQAPPLLKATIPQNLVASLDHSGEIGPSAGTVQKIV
jgi:hypothetical protein